MPYHLGKQHGTVEAPLSPTLHAARGLQVAIESVQSPRHALSTPRPSVPIHDVSFVGNSIHGLQIVVVAVSCPSQGFRPCCSPYVEFPQGNRTERYRSRCIKGPSRHANQVVVEQSAGERLYLNAQPIDRCRRFLRDSCGSSPNLPARFQSGSTPLSALFFKPRESYPRLAPLPLEDSHDVPCLLLDLNGSPAQLWSALSYSLKMLHARRWIL